MERDALARVSAEVTRSFPEMAGVRPSVRRQEAPRTGVPQYLLIYKGSGELPGGRTISRVVRVVADEDGRIVRISTSK